MIDQIYVAMRVNGEPTWKAVDAQPLGDKQYLILGNAAADEDWEFQPGTRVRCKKRNLDGGRVRVATQQI